MAIRFDTGTLSKIKRTPQGGIRVDAALTRTGLFRYALHGGKERVEYRPPEEVFAEDSLASLADAPVTSLHHGFVDASNFARVTVGNLSGAPAREENRIVGKLVIQDAETIRLVKEGSRREVSCGYTCDLDMTPGVTPEGERYDGVQRNICYNHIALVPKGRAGSEIALRLDAEDNQLTEDAAPVTAPAAPDPREAELAELRARVARFDAETAERARRELADTVAKVGVVCREDASCEDMRRAAVEKAFPGAIAKDASAETLAGAFACAMMTLSAPPPKPVELRADAAPDQDPPHVRARKEMLARNAKLFVIGERN